MHHHDDYAHYLTIIQVRIIFLSYYYNNNLFLMLLYEFSFPTHYLHYDNYSDKNLNDSYNAYNQHNSIKFMYTPPHTLKWCMASDSGLNCRNAFVYIQGSYSSKNIAKSRLSVHLRLGLQPQETGVALSLTRHSYTSGTLQSRTFGRMFILPIC